MPFPNDQEAHGFDMSKQNTKLRRRSQRKAPTTPVPSPHPDTNKPPHRLPAAHSAAPEIQNYPWDLEPPVTHRALVLGEDERRYDEFLARVTQAVVPRDVIEDLWVKDVVNEIWEAQRYRRIKASLLKMAAKDHLVRILRTAKYPETERPLTPDGAHLLTICCLQGDEEAIEQVKDILSDYALDLDSIMARALADCLDAVERIDRLIAGADARREKALSNVDRRREAFSRQLRRVAEDLASDSDPAPVKLP